MVSASPSPEYKSTVSVSAETVGVNVVDQSATTTLDHHHHRPHPHPYPQPQQHQCCVYAVLSIDNLKQLRTETDYSLSVLQHIQTGADTSTSAAGLQSPHHRQQQVSTVPDMMAISPHTPCDMQSLSLSLCLSVSVAVSLLRT